MQTELAEAGLPIQILAVNESGFDAGLATIGDIGVLPVLQDTPAIDAWDTWDVTFRDVVILDAEGREYAVFNLTTHSLSVASNYDALKGLFMDAAATIDGD